MNYIHGGNGFEYGNDILDFSANINPLGTPKGVLTAMVNAVSEVDKYPDYKCRALREAIAERECVSPDNIICGNGAAELIYSALYALRPQRVLINKPSFSEYFAAVKASGGTVVSHGRADIEFICNPNNPTGELIEKDLIMDKLNRNDSLIFVDECFNDFINEPEKYSCVDKTGTHKNLVIIKSFTKMYAIPGVRLGYMITSNTELTEKIYAARQPWSVSTIAQAAGIAAASDMVTPRRVREYIAEEQEYLCGEFNRLGIEYIKPTANYIFFHGAHDLKEKLLKHNILIRSCANYEGLKDTDYRAAIRTHDENILLIKAMEAIMWQKQ